MATTAVGRHHVWQQCSLVCLLLAILPAIYSGIATGETDNRIMYGNLIKSDRYKDGIVSSDSADKNQLDSYAKRDQVPNANAKRRSVLKDKLMYISIPEVGVIKQSDIDLDVSAHSETGRDGVDSPPRGGDTLIFTRGCHGGDCQPITPSNSRPPPGSRPNTPPPQANIKELDHFSTHRLGKPISRNLLVIDAPASGGVRYPWPPRDVRSRQRDVWGKTTSPDGDSDLNQLYFKPRSAAMPWGEAKNRLITPPHHSEGEQGTFSQQSDVSSAPKRGHNTPEIGNESAVSRWNDRVGYSASINMESHLPSRARSIHTDSDTSQTRLNGVIHSHLNRNNKQNLIIGAIPSWDISWASVRDSSPPTVGEARVEYKAGSYSVKLSVRGHPTSISRTKYLGSQTTNHPPPPAAAEDGNSKSPRLEQAQIGYSKVNSPSIERPMSLGQFTRQVKVKYLRKLNSIVGKTTLFRNKRDAAEEENTPGIDEKSNPENVSAANETEADDSGQGHQQLHNQSSPGISLRSEGLVGLIDPSKHKSRFGGGESTGGEVGESQQMDTVIRTDIDPNSYQNITAGNRTSTGDADLGGFEVESGSVEEPMLRMMAEAEPPDTYPESPNNDTIYDVWTDPESQSNSTLDGAGKAVDNFTQPRRVTSWADGSEGGLPESHTDTKPEYLPEPETEWGPEPTSEGCHGPACYAEPTPDWDVAKQEWKAAWEVHIYGAGILFAILAVYSLISIIGLVRKRELMSQGYFISLNIMLFLMCSTRAVYFLVDGYNSGGTFHPILAYFLYSLTFPCMTSAFSVLFLALLQTLKMQLLSPKIQKPAVLVGIITFHFVLSITTDVVIGLIADVRVMLVVCEIFFVLWGLFLFCAYIYIFRKLYMAAHRRHKDMLRLAISQSKLAGGEGLQRKKAPRPVFNAAVKITLVTAILGLITTGLEIYAIIGILDLDGGVPDPWPWWGLNLGARLAEVCMCVTMSYVATQPFRYNRINSSEKQTTSCLDVIYLVPCHRSCAEADVKDQYVTAPTECSYSQPTTYNPAYGYVNEYIYNTANAANGVQLPEEPGTPTATNPNDSLKSRSLDSKAEKKRKSMLVNDEGFVRFRHDEDPEGEFIVSTDDELNSNDGVLTNGSVPGVKCNGCPRSLTYYLANGPTTGSPRRFHSISVPNTGDNTPATPRSYCSTDFELDMAGSVFSFRPPSSIHLRDSIEGALNYYPRFTLKTPDYIDTPESLSLSRAPPDELDVDDYHSAKSGPPDSPTPALPSGDLSPSVHGNRLCTRSMGDIKTTWFHKSPKNYWCAISQARARNSNLSLASRSSSRYSPLDDTVLSSRHRVTNLYRSNSDSIADAYNLKSDVEEDINV